MPFNTRVNPVDALNIKGIFQGLSQLPMMEQKARQDAEFNAARTYATQMTGDKYGAEAAETRFGTSQRTGADAAIAANPAMPSRDKQMLTALKLVGPKALNDYMSAYNTSATIQDRDQLVAGQGNAGQTGQAYAATEGKPLFNAVGNTGRSENIFTGQGVTIDPTLAGNYDKEIVAKIFKTNAAGTKSLSGVRVDNARIGDIGARAADRRTKASSGESQVIGTDENGNQIYAEPTKPGKPLPASSLKLQQESLDVIGIASGTQSDIEAIESQIKTGKLDFGLVSNLANRGKNLFGASDEQSRNFSSFRANMEKLRNDSLRLNKGVQTDGDAQRAWNELFENINDKEVVSQRLAEIKEINARAVRLHKLNVDTIRKNYGHGPMDFDGYTNMPAAIGAKPGQPRPAAPAAATALSPSEQAELAALKQRFGKK